MKPKEIYSYELLLVDESGKTEITCVKSMLLALSYSEKLWKKAEVKASTIDDKSLDIHLQAQKVSTDESALESAFLIKVKSSSFDKTEAFRQNLLTHAKKKLGFSTIRVLADGVSTKIAQDIYPLVTEVENTLRSFIAKYHLQHSGIQWWQKTAPKSVIDKVNSRKKNEGAFADLVDMDISLTDFEDLTILSGKTLTESSFQTKWQQLSDIRNKVMHNHLFVSKDLTATVKLTGELLKFIATAEQKIGTLKVTTSAKSTAPVKKVAEKVEVKKKAVVKKQEPKPKAPKKTPVAKIKPVVEKASTQVKKIAEEPIVQKTEERPVAEQRVEVEVKPEKIEAPVVQKTEPTPPVSFDSFKMISEDDLLKELKIAESSSTSFIDLKAFVNEVLVPKGYASGPTFSLARMMSGKGLVDIYDTKDAQGLPVKAVKTQ